MLRLEFTANDLALTRFLPMPAPLLEMKFASRALRQGICTPWGERWRSHALAAFPISTAPRRALVNHFSWSLSPTVLGDNFDEGMQSIHELSRQQANAELTVFGRGPTEGSGAPHYLRHALAGDHAANMALGRMTTSAYRAVLEPYWPDIQANHQIELARQGRLMARHGVRAALSELIPGARWNGHCLEIDSPQRRTIALRGRGMVLTPSVFWAGPPLVGELDDQPVILAYPTPIDLLLRVGEESDPLAAILGSTRAAVLRVLSEERTTSNIARELGISPASASEHTSALRRARLVRSRRDGKAVIHDATALGLDLIDANRW
ncbi:helix-turn-helix domain-containing protein [Mycobacterium sp. CBMA271]|uniref:helix-turn-helix domain-containing protein n=1 Tax=unclassified Mycobacteroides TaxID=2618759 RepID=UPI001320E683|nr:MULTISPECIES: helix-turn-helix domain-containing protein [unclassified Mycobacteroides]MUM15507.1 transcriptional regulator [Mycobacteroides sp. CBMA 326]MUM20304.1 helix-turn-helix domain-containing protein [Mycobacteroides sp. CBMA 271]